VKKKIQLNQIKKKKKKKKKKKMVATLNTSMAGKTVRRPGKSLTIHLLFSNKCIPKNQPENKGVFRDGHEEKKN
jgi:hypothetical protein